MTAWSDLPNARHIDAVLASLKADPDKWVEVWDKAGGWTEALSMARIAARDEVHNVGRDSARAATWSAIRVVVQDAAWVVVQDAARVAAWNAITALVAYDDCAHLLTTNPEHVKMLAGIGNEAAILLYPASLIFSELKNECLV